MNLDWLNSIYFTDIEIRYIALNTGYLGHFAGRKFRAVLKSILQSQSPCLDQRDMNCASCLLKTKCPFFLLNGSEFKPYLIQVNDGAANNNGAFVPGRECSFSLKLLGECSSKSEQITAEIKKKPLISIDGPGNKKLIFSLVSVVQNNGGHPVRLGDIVSSDNCPWNQQSGPIRQVTIEFTTPMAFKYKNKTLTEPNDFTFPVFMEAIIRRLGNIAKILCGFTGRIPATDTILQETGDVAVIQWPGFRFVNNKANKAYKIKSHGGKTEEYIGGLKGGLSLVGNLDPCFPLVAAASSLNIGRHTTQGMGHFQIIDVGCQS